MKNGLFLMLSVVVLGACTLQRGQDNPRKGVTRTLVGQEMKFQNLEGYGIVCLYDDYLFLKEDRDTSRLIAYRVEGDTLKYFKGLINRGRGPREVYYAEYSLCNDTLFVSNSDPTGMKAIYGIPLSDMNKIDDSNRWKEYSFSENGIMTGLSFARLDDGVFIIAGGLANTQQIFSLMDFNTNNRIPLLFWPKDSTQGPLESKQMVYMQSHLNAENGKILYANMYARYMFVASVAGNELVKDAVIYSSLPRYVVKPDGNIRYTEEGEYGIQPYTTAKYIYARIGRTVREVKKSDTYKGYPKQYVDEVEVYDWKGTFIENFRTERPFYSFAISSDNRFLYTMTIDLDTKEPVILRYELPF